MRAPGAGEAGRREIGRDLAERSAGEIHAPCFLERTLLVAIGDERITLAAIAERRRAVGDALASFVGESRGRALTDRFALPLRDDPALAGNGAWLVGGCYEIDLTKRHARWHIVALTLARAWAEGNLDLPRIAAERAKKYG